MNGHRTQKARLPVPIRVPICCKAGADLRGWRGLSAATNYAEIARVGLVCTLEKSPMWHPVRQGKGRSLGRRIASSRLK